MNKKELSLCRKQLPKGISLVLKNKIEFKILEQSHKFHEVKGMYVPSNQTVYLNPKADYWTFYHERLHVYFDKYYGNYLNAFFYLIEEVIVALITVIVRWFKER